MFVCICIDRIEQKQGQIVYRSEVITPIQKQTNRHTDKQSVRQIIKKEYAI